MQSYRTRGLSKGVTLGPCVTNILTVTLVVCMPRPIEGYIVEADSIDLYIRTN